MAHGASARCRASAFTSTLRGVIWSWAHQYKCPMLMDATEIGGHGFIGSRKESDMDEIKRVGIGNIRDRSLGAWRSRNAVLDEVIQQLDEQMPCHCIDAYKDRGLIDPQCERHDFATLVEDMKNG